jgi:hypothetical protein
MVQGRPGLYFFTERIYTPESPNSRSFLYTNTFLPPSWQATDASSIKGFMRTVQPVLETAFEFIARSKFVLLGATTLVQTTENYLGLSQRFKASASWFPRQLLPMSPSSNVSYVDEPCHTVGWSSLKVSEVLFLRIARCTPLRSMLL